MQGQGMSLSAAEKVRVVHALDRLGVHFVEAGEPSSAPLRPSSAWSVRPGRSTSRRSPASPARRTWR
jgi:isopropylmalate/homocitrate/citramalate synthase